MLYEVVEDVGRLERLERTAFEMVVQALWDYRRQAKSIFREETDQAQDIAEDVMREAVEAMGLPGFQERLYGKVDYKRAIYVFVPEAQPVAMMLDAKAEMEDSSATIQMSQTSMKVQFLGTQGAVDERGKLSQTIERDGRSLHVVSVIAKYVYSNLPKGFDLEQIIAACIPNGKLQERYNPAPEDTIWRVGRHSSKRGEEFRVRLSFPKLRDKASWRVRNIDMRGV